MKNYKMSLQYDGTRYDGWQKQGNTKNTIQGKLEEVCSRMLGEAIEIQGSGRTDAGVHAAGQVANFRSGRTMKPEEILRYLNAYLPQDIAVLSVEEVPERFHSRLLATSKEYRYRVWNSPIPNVFERRFVYQDARSFSIDAMQKAAAYCLGEHDFQSFSSVKRSKKTTVRILKHLYVERIGDEIRFAFEGNGFLYNMVRILVGTLLEVGEGKREPESIPWIFEQKNREAAGFTAPPQGLTLMKVHYKV